MSLRSALTRGLCALIPVKKNRVVFSSYLGRGYSDSPRAICEALLHSGRDLDLCWLVGSEAAAQTLPQGVRPVPNRGLKKLLTLASARVWVDNCRKWERVKKRSQFYLQTWHGFALKRIEADVGAVLEPDYSAAARADSAQCDLIVSGSRFMTDLYRRAFWYDGAVEEFGTPRNDVFFGDLTPIRARVLKALGLPEDRKLLLYAPTFRADKTRTDCYALDADRIRAACEDRFGGVWSVLIRLHPNAAGASEGLFAYDGDRLLNVTAYPDMQELLCGADLLITDYSSSMFDYALTGKPCLQFAADLEAYRQDRNFYFDLAALPFPLAEDQAGLEEQIRSYDGQLWQERWAAFRAENGFCEDGRGAARAANWILSRLK